MKKLTLTTTPGTARIAAEYLRDIPFLDMKLRQTYTNVWEAIIDEDEEDEMLSCIEETLFLGASLENEDFDYTTEEC